MKNTNKKSIYFTIFNKVHIIFIEKYSKQTIKNESTVMFFFVYIDNFIVEEGGATTTEMHTEAFTVYSEFVNAYKCKTRIKACLEKYLELEKSYFDFDYSGVDGRSKKILIVKINRLIRSYKNYKQLFDILQNSSTYRVSNSLLISLISYKCFFIHWEIADIKNMILDSKHLAFSSWSSVKNKLQFEAGQQAKHKHKTESEYRHEDWEGCFGRANFSHIEYVREIKHTEFWSLDEQFFLSKSPVSNYWYAVDQAWEEQIQGLYGYKTADQLVGFYNNYLKLCIFDPLESSCWLWCNESEKIKQSTIIQGIKNAMKKPFINSKNLKTIESYHSFIVNSLEVSKKKAENDYFCSIRFVTVQNSLNVLEKAPRGWKEYNLKSIAAALTFCSIELKIIELELTRFNG